jgi:hypothetical protein
LLALARERLGNAALATHALGLFQSKTDLYRRMHMLMQSNGALERRCSLYWRMGYSTLLVVALVLLVGTLGVRRAAAQAADAVQKAAEVDKRNADEQAAVAAQREAEVAKLRAQQEQILTQLKALEVEKRQLEAELAQRKTEGGKADDASVVYRRMIAQRQQAIAQARESQAAELAAKVTAQEQNAKANDERQAMKDWVNKKPGGNREPNEFAGRAQLDLVSLANSYVDAVGSVSIAQVRMQAMEEAKDIAGVRIEKVNMDTARRKVAIFKGIAQAALEAAKSDLETAMQQVKMGLAPTNAVNEPQSRLKILEVILAQ